MLTNERVKSAFEAYRLRTQCKYPGDVAFIRAVLYDTYGVELSEVDAIQFWEWYSDAHWCATWMKPIREDIVPGFLTFIAEAEAHGTPR